MAVCLRNCLDSHQKIMRSMAWVSTSLLMTEMKAYPLILPDIIRCRMLHSSNPCRNLWHLIKLRVHVLQVGLRTKIRSAYLINRERQEWTSWLQTLPLSHFTRTMSHPHSPNTSRYLPIHLTSSPTSRHSRSYASLLVTIPYRIISINSMWHQMHSGVPASATDPPFSTTKIQVCPRT